MNKADFRGVLKLRAATGSRLAIGLVLNNGDTSMGCGDGLYTVPPNLLWATPKMPV